jgi:hypothetical protein
MRRGLAARALALGAHALLYVTLIAACGEGREVNMGAVPSASEKPDPIPPASCGDAPCANHTGFKLFVEADAEGAPLDAFDSGLARPAGTDAGREPSLLYPSHESLLPVNLTRLRFAWTTGESTLFSLDFSGPRSSVRVVTRASSWIPTREAWRWIAESNRGGSVELIVRAIHQEGSEEVWSSVPSSLFFSASPLEGTVYYWSTGSRGLMRAGLDSVTPERVFTDPAGDEATTCTGCHTVSRDGTRLAAGYEKNAIAEISLLDGSTLVPLGGVAVEPAPAAPAPDAGPAPPKPEKAPPAVWSTFSPDGKLLLVAGGGKLRLVDADSGAPIGAEQGLVPLPDGTTATHPDWSPLGDHVAVTLGRGGDQQTEEGSIARLPYSDGAFGAPELLVPSAGGKDNNFFPSFSPDGRFIAYVNASGGSEDARSARLRLFDVTTSTIHELDRLNARVGGADGLVDLGNTMPTWAPSTESGRYWLAFSSLRAYSDERPQDAKRDQLWIAGLEPTLADPGYAAFWAPFQSISQGNHRAFWTPVVPAHACGCLEHCADGVDNDCDGQTDEADCRANCSASEVCDDGVDDDCDCVVDDCSVEVCGDGIDNDGDGHDDKMDLACK